MKWNFGLVLALSLLCAGGARAQQAAGADAPAPGTQQGQALNKQIVKTISVKYLLYLPKDYGKDPQAKWPLMLFLHGSGERGDDVQKVKTHGPPKLVAHGQDFPFILVSPQCPANDWWHSDTLIALLDEIAAKYTVDPDRVYLTGLSMGGYGTWDLATNYPDRFAAIAPICGGGNPRMAARRLRNMPIWIFHGGKDPTVPIKEAQDMVDAFKASGVDVKFTVYPDAGHDSWTQTYDNPELFKWFLAQKRSAGAKL